MDDSSLSGAFLSGSGFLGLDSSIPKPYGRNPNRNNQHMQLSMDEITGLEKETSFPMSFGKRKAISLLDDMNMNNNNNNNLSEDDEPSYNEDGKKGSPWQRMKWTDNVVRLLISVVACVGEDGNYDVAEGLKRKSGSLQKKGKWKTVSKVMITKGCLISPQQCEDKFNDLNKRYKKLNDILGRGTSCKVVEDPSLLDSMRNLSSKMKEDVKKILSSKHLFYQEMCAYHNGQKIPNCDDLELPPVGVCSKENSEEFFVSEDDGSDYEDHHHTICDDVEIMRKHDEKGKQIEEGGSLWIQPDVFVGFETDIAEVSENPTKSRWERKQSIKKQLLNVQEQGVRIQAEAFEIEQRRFKWKRFCSKKEAELERLRLDNERMKLENERMLLQLKYKEMEIDYEAPGASLDTAF